MLDTSHIEANRPKADVRIKRAALMAKFTNEFPVIIRLADASKRVHKRFQLIK